VEGLCGIARHGGEELVGPGISRAPKAATALLVAGYRLQMPMILWIPPADANDFGMSSDGTTS